MEKTFRTLNQSIVTCVKCPRLVQHREHVPMPKRYKEEGAWRKPLPGFGDPEAKLFILGLAPSPLGGNRTGRIFTGDESAKFLMKALFTAGFANQPISESKEDGLLLNDCFITASVKCAPPSHKPLPSEFDNCRPYFENELFLLKNLKAVLALGKLAFDSYVKFAKTVGTRSSNAPFTHGQKIYFPEKPTLYGSFHPSPQNTYTKKLTMEMFLTLLQEIRDENGI